MAATTNLPAGDEAVLIVEDLVKTFAEGKARKGETVRAVGGVSFKIEPGAMFTLLGPSGCGKTTTLRCIAGLERPDSGHIAVRGTTLFSSEAGIDVQANERGLGMVFQSYAIWPHMNVFQNVAFPLQVVDRKRKQSRSDIREKVEQVLSVVQLDELVDRQATDLSGGQQQRLALARALVMEPPLLLLDEPLSNLDAKLREEMRFELKDLQRRLGITAIYVTHDQVEALAMSNRVAVMNAGKIEQIGKPREIYESPSSLFVADFIGTSNFIAGRVAAEEPGDTFLVETAAGTLYASSSAPFATDDPVTVAVRPEQVSIEKGTFPARAGVWNGRVTNRAFLGESVDHVVAVGGFEIRCRSNPSISIPPDSDVTITFNEREATILPADA